MDIKQFNTITYVQSCLAHEDANIFTDYAKLSTKGRSRVQRGKKRKPERMNPRPRPTCAMKCPKCLNY